MNITINLITNLQETVQNTVLSKILAAKRNNGTINLTGNIYISAAYANEVLEFCTYFGLTEDENSPGTYRGNNIILSIGTSYISFQDNEVARIVNGTFGTDGHTTVLLAKNTVFTSSTFKNNTVILTFPEFDLFTKANNNPPGELFYGCTNLIEINLNNVSIISNNEFQGTGITEINAPSLSSLGAQAFNNSKAQRIISLGNITSIPDRCFGYCTDLETVILPSSVTSIEQGGFMNNESLTTINLNNITNIGNSGFNSCNLLNINVSNLSNIITLGGGVFERCYNIYGELNLPKLVSAGNNCFDSCGSITKVKCIGKLTSIPERFIPRVSNGTSSLTEVYLPYECTSLGVNAFHRCGNLTTIKLYTQSVDDWIEGETPAFGTLSKITTFSELCFVDCTSLQLTSNDIQGAVTIGNNAFKGVVISGTLNLPNLASLGYRSFFEMGITSIQNLGSVTSIPEECFRSCASLTSIILPQSITSIESGAFANCNKLILDVSTLPQSITEIKNEAFVNCTNITGTLNLPNLTNIVGTAFKNTNITSISNLGNITTLPSGTFEGCRNLTSVLLPSTLTTINVEAFNDTAITRLLIPEGVTTIQDSSFLNCSPNISYVELPSTISNINFLFHRMFDAVSASDSVVVVIKATTPPQAKYYASWAIESTNVTKCRGIYVPDASVSAYTSITDSDNPWSRSDVKAKVYPISLLLTDSPSAWLIYNRS